MNLCIISLGHLHINKNIKSLLCSSKEDMHTIMFGHCEASKTLLFLPSLLVQDERLTNNTILDDF